MVQKVYAMLPKERLRVQEIGGLWYVQVRMVSFVTGGYKWITLDEMPFDTRKDAEEMLPFCEIA